MAHVEKRTRNGQTSWRVRYREHPRAKEQSQTFALKKDATEFLHQTETSKSWGTYVDHRAGRVALATWADRWLAGVRPPTLKPKTFASYESLLRSRVLPAFGNHPVAELKPSDIQAWVGTMTAEGLSPSRIRQTVVVLRQILDAAQRDGIIGRNPALGIKLPRLQHHEAPYFDPDVVGRIADAMPPPYDLLTRVLGTLGLRWGEAAALRVRHVDLLRRRLRVEESLAEVSGRFVFGSTKAHSARSVPLPPGLATALESHIRAMGSVGPDAMVFTGPKGGPLRYRYFYMRLWRPVLEQLALPPVGIHALRHSAAARMIAADASPKALQQVLGHRSAAFSLTVYGHIFDADLDELAARLETPAAPPRPRPVSYLADQSEK